MNNNYGVFISALQNMNLVRIVFNSKEKGFIERKCIPLDFGPWRNKLPERYHFFDLDSPDKPHPLSVQLEDLQQIEVLDDKFSEATLASIITWKFNWHYKRDWGKFS